MVEYSTLSMGCSHDRVLGSRPGSYVGVSEFSGLGKQREAARTLRDHRMAVARRSHHRRIHLFLPWDHHMDRHDREVLLSRPYLLLSCQAGSSSWGRPVVC